MSSDDGAPDDGALDDGALDDGALDEVQWAPPAPNSDASRTWLPFAAAAVVMVVLIGVVIALRGTGPHSALVLTSDGSLTCPKSVQQPDKPYGTVPAKPTGVDGSKRLVPDRTPTTVTVCSYPGNAYVPKGQTRKVKLAGRRVLAGSLHRVADSLTLQPAGQGPPGCEQYLASTDGDDYLIGLTYGTDTLWVAVPGDHCDGATNGQFRTSTNLRTFAAAAYTAKHWVSDPPRGPGAAKSGPCEPDDVGRLGQEKSLVPAGYSSLTVCGADSKRHVTLGGHSAAPIVAALNALPTRRSDEECKPLHGKLGISYNVVARYPSGPAVLVMISPGCNPPIDNSALQATRVGSVVSLIQAALS